MNRTGFGKGAQKPPHVFAAQQRDIRPGVNEADEITGKLDEVAKTLLIPHEDALAVQILAGPGSRAFDNCLRRRVGTVPPAFEIVKARFQQPFEKERPRPVVPRVRIIGLMQQRLIEARQRFINLARFLQGDAKAGQSFGIIGTKAQRFIIRVTSTQAVDPTLAERCRG